MAAKLSRAAAGNSNEAIIHELEAVTRLDDTTNSKGTQEAAKYGAE